MNKRKGCRARSIEQASGARKVVNQARRLQLADACSSRPPMKAARKSIRKRGPYVTPQTTFVGASATFASSVVGTQAELYATSESAATERFVHDNHLYAELWHDHARFNSEALRCADSRSERDEIRGAERKDLERLLNLSAVHTRFSEDSASERRDGAGSDLKQAAAVGGAVVLLGGLITLLVLACKKGD